MELWLYKSASLTLTSSSRSLKESTLDNSRHPGMACFTGSGRSKSQAHQDKVTPGNVPFSPRQRSVSGHLVSQGLRRDQKVLSWAAGGQDAT